MRSEKKRKAESEIDMKRSALTTSVSIAIIECEHKMSLLITIVVVR